MATFNCNIGFKEIVTNIFHRWTAFRLAVEHGMGGSNSNARALTLIEYISNYCLEKKAVAVEDLQNVIEDEIDYNFNTYCEDGSIQEISQELIKYLTLYKQGRFEEIKLELSKLPGACGISTSRTYNNSSSSDDDDDDEDDEDDGEHVMSNNENPQIQNQFIVSEYQNAAGDEDMDVTPDQSYIVTDLDNTDGKQIECGNMNDSEWTIVNRNKKHNKMK